MFETTTRQYVRASVTDTKTKYLKPSVSKHNLTYTATSQQTTFTLARQLLRVPSSVGYGRTNICRAKSQ